MLKLSEAILLGATMEKPGDMGGGNLRCGIPHLVDTRCAIELALIAAGRPEIHWGDVRLVWPWIRDVYQFTSAWDREFLNRRMSLDAYVDWVRSVEPTDLPAEPLAAAPAEQQVETVGALETVPGPISL